MANWLSFHAIENWSGVVLLGFQYDHITDEEIASALADTENLKMVQPKLDWQDDSFLANSTDIPDAKKHAYRVASLVVDFKSRGMSEPIELDTFTANRCPSCIPDGHHRIRALQFLGLTSAPFNLSGDIDLLEELVAIAGVSIPQQAKQYVNNRLWNLSDTDIL